MTIFETMSEAVADLRGGLRKRAIWLELAREDIDDSHRQTWLGPAWLVLNFLIFLGALYLIFGRRDENFLAYLASGLVIWVFVNELLSQSVAVFLHNESFIKGTTLPLSVYVLRLSARSLLRASYALVTAMIIIAIFSPLPSLAALSIIPAIALIALTTPAVVMLMGVLGAYFPDMQFVVTNMLRIMMFLTPIFWTPSGDGIRQLLYTVNPLTYFIEIVREPLVSGTVPLHAWGVASLLSVALWLGGLYFLGRCRHQIVFLV